VVKARHITHCTEGWVDTRTTLDVWGEERYSCFHRGSDREPSVL